MTHPLRYKEPYAAKIGEWWITKHWKTPVLVLVKNNIGFDVQHKRVPEHMTRNIMLDSFIRRHFRDQAERDAAPAIPPVEGARMMLRNGEVTEPMFKSDSVIFKDSTDFKKGRFWELDGYSIYNSDTIAVHTWPEDVK